jgi:hypothetical protein
MIWRYQQTEGYDNLREARKQQYQEEKRKYAATLRKPKMISWKQYCNETTTSNPWNAAYKLATGNIKKMQHSFNAKKARQNNYTGLGRNDTSHDKNPLHQPTVRNPTATAINYSGRKAENR